MCAVYTDYTSMKLLNINDMRGGKVPNSNLLLLARHLVIPSCYNGILVSPAIVPH